MTESSPEQPFALKQMTAPDQPAPPKRRRGLLVLAGLATVAGLLLATSAALYVTTGTVPGIYTDPGIAACEAMRDHSGLGNGVSAKDWSAEDYRRVRGQFADSHHQDIRDAGTKMTDMLWQFNSVGKDNGLGATLVMGGSMIQSYGALAGACANHGIDLPKLGS